MASVRKAVPDGQADEALATAGSPSSGSPADAGRPTQVPKVVVPGRRLRTLPVRQAVRRRLATTPTAPAPRLVGSAFVLSTVEVQATTLPGPEAASSVPVRRPIPIGVATGPTEALAAGERAFAARPVRPVPGVPTTVVPAVVVAAAASEVPRLAAGATGLGGPLALETEAYAGALRRPCGTFRQTAATSLVQATSVAPAPVPCVRGVAPASCVARTSEASSVTKATAASRRRPSSVPGSVVAEASAASVTACLARTSPSSRGPGLTFVASGLAAATSTVPGERLPSASGLASLTAYGPGLPSSVTTGPVPLSKARRLASEVTAGQGLMASAPAAVRPWRSSGPAATAAVPALHDFS